ncbi:MAG TPA: DNA internalization-related competence protein ComEC/Rec2 [Longimicrobiales bacterium]|nr:DNA internalization-related competence protein ComEC/Rec2 [Longimicrobiales bacterium]
MTRLALAFAAGAAWVLAGAPVGWAPLLAAAWLLWPRSTSSRPGPGRALWASVALVGLGATWLADPEPGCAPPGDGRAAELEGVFLAAPRSGSAAFERAAGCGTVTVVTADSTAPAGRPLRLEGTWRAGRGRPWFLAREVRPAAADGTTDEPAWRWLAVRWRDGLVERLGRLYGEHAPLVAALTLARTEGFDPELRQAFARVGIAHMLSISGYHVAVIAVVVLALLRALGQGARTAGLAAAAVSWAYVAFIGLPDAAVRAAIMLTFAALARARGRPVARWGPVSAALLVLLAADPRKLGSIGFQLSFAGVAGLVAWAGPLSSAARRLTRGRAPEALTTGLAAGLAATAATLPIAAWHFEQVSLVGVPATLAATPLVTLALVGSLATLAIDFVAPGAASVLAGGVSVVLDALELGTAALAARPWASVWVTRGTVLAGTCGLLLAAQLARRPRMGARARRGLTVLHVASGIVAWPLLVTWQGRGTAEVVVIDVGQGDGIALRTPRGRWLLVDAGPAPEGDPAGHPVVRALRARGVLRLEAVVLTHADLDHVGGAAAVLEAFQVGAVYDPAVPAGKEAFVDALEVAQERDIPWRAARAGDRLEVDGLVLEVLHPTAALDPDAETNETSVVMHLRFGEFDALLTGDAYKDVERALLPLLPRSLEVLKVGHHGSDTSTGPLLLERAPPEVALVSVGRYNRYGHPSPAVLARLEASGARIHRTDAEGTLMVLARRDGSWVVRAERPRIGEGGR